MIEVTLRAYPRYWGLPYWSLELIRILDSPSMPPPCLHPFEACFHPQVAPQHCATGRQLGREVRTEEFAATKVTLRLATDTGRFEICLQRSEGTLCLFRDPKEETKVGTWTPQGKVRTFRTSGPRHCGREGVTTGAPGAAQSSPASGRLRYAMGCAGRMGKRGVGSTAGYGRVTWKIKVTGADDSE